MWFGIAIVAMLLLAGQVLFGHFEEQMPRSRKLLETAFAIALFASISYFFGRFWCWIALIAAFIPPLVIHVWWLPKHGINGWMRRAKE